MTTIENEDTTPVSLEKRNQAYPVQRQIVFILGVGLLLAALILAGIVGKYERDYADKIYPGISVAGVDLSGLTLGQAVVNLNANLTYGRFGQLYFSNGQDNWVYTPEDLGFSYNPVEVANEAFAIGRDKGTLVNLGEQLKARSEGVISNPGIVYDQAKAYAVIQGLAAQTNIALVEPSISLDKTTVSVITGQAGRSVDILATLRNIEPFLLLQQSGNLPMVIKEQTPVSVNVEDTAQLAASILSQAFTINPADPAAGQGPWTIEPEALASLLSIEQKELEEIVPIH